LLNASPVVQRSRVEASSKMEQAEARSPDEP
jgi:hypothetical protein